MLKVFFHQRPLDQPQFTEAFNKTASEGGYPDYISDNISCSCNTHLVQRCYTSAANAKSTFSTKDPLFSHKIKKPKTK